MPLPDNSGCIAFPLQHLRNGHFAVTDTDPGIGSQCPIQTDPVWITTGHQARPGGGANRLSRIKVGESHALRRQSVDMWRYIIYAAVGIEVSISHIVHEDQYDIGTGTRRLDFLA